MRYDMITPGRYLATATGSAIGRAKSGTEQIAVGFDVHVEDPETKQQSAMHMTWFGFFTDATLETTDKALAALGFDATVRDISELNPEVPEDSPIVGAEVEVVLQHKEDLDGNQRLEIRWVNRKGGGVAMKDRMEATEAKSFAANLRKRLLAARGPGAGKPAGAPARPAPAAAGRPGAPASKSHPAKPQAAPEGQSRPCSLDVSCRFDDGHVGDCDSIPF